MSDTSASNFPKQPITRRRRTLEQRLELARLDENKAAARLARKTNRVRKMEATRSARERKLDTRRKIVVGALAWSHREHDGYFNTALMKLLDDYVLRDDERALVGLAPLPPEVRDRALEAFKQASLAKRRGRKASD